MTINAELYGVVSEHVLDVPILETDDLVLSMQLLDFEPGVAIMHCEVKNWSLRKYKGFIDIWVEVLAALEDKGIRHLLTVTKEEDDKNKRFAEMFGFTFKGILVDDNTTEEYAIYELETKIDGS